MSNPTHPIITFTINIPSDKIGILQPARYQTDQDLAVCQMNQFDNLLVTWLPNIIRENMEQANGYTFTAYGQNATYLKQNYTSGDTNFLTIVSETYASAGDN